MFRGYTVQVAGGACLKPFLCTHPAANGAKQVERYCKGLFDPVEAVRRGCGVALVAMPRESLLPALPSTVDSLCRASDISHVTEIGDAEARVKAIQAVVAIAREVYGSDTQGGGAEVGDVLPSIEHSSSTADIESICVQRIVPALFRALQDYTTDNRGDVGSWCDTIQ